MMRTHLRDEFELLLKIGASTRSSSTTRTGAGTNRASFGPARLEETAVRG
jgi:hypothetical protein